MGVVDTLMVGRVSPQAIGAVGLGSILYFSAAIFGMGMLLGLDTFVSQSYGAGNTRECHRWLRDGVHLAVLATVPLMAITFGLVPLMPSWACTRRCSQLTAPYCRIVAWGSLPLLLYAAFRRYLQALGMVWPVMITLIAANLVNAGANWVLIYGHLGMPAMGAPAPRGPPTSGASSWRCRSLVIPRTSTAHGGPVRRAVPAGRVGSARAAVSAGRSGRHAAHRGGRRVRRRRRAGRPHRSIALAAHQVALNLASVTFMVPLGPGVGRRGPRRACHRPRSVEAAASAGGAVIALGLGFMSLGPALHLRSGAARRRCSPTTRRWSRSASRC